MREKDLKNFLSIPDNAYERLGGNNGHTYTSHQASLRGLLRLRTLRTAKMCRVPVRHVTEAEVQMSMYID